MRAIEFLTERASSAIYHYTNIYAALKIIKTGQFELSSTYGSIEQKLAKKGAPYFLSTTRTLQGGYHDIIGSSAVMFNLDGNYFNSKYKAGPVDYWGERHNDYGKKSEAEDRIFSNSPTIPIGNGILSIYVYAEPMDEKGRKNWGEHIPATVRQLFIASKVKGIPIFLYEDKSAWRSQDKRKVIPITGPRETLKGKELSSKTYQGRSYLEPWLELIYKDKQPELTERADKLRYDMVYSYRTFRSDGADYGLGNELSNARKPGNSDREQAIKLISIMQRNGWKTPKEVAKFLTDKWIAIAGLD